MHVFNLLATLVALMKARKAGYNFLTGFKSFSMAEPVPAIVRTRSHPPNFRRQGHQKQGLS